VTRDPGKKGKGAGGFRQNSPPFIPYLVTFRGRGAAAGPRAATAGRPPGHGGGRREGEKDEGDEGVCFPHSPWVEAARGGGSTGGGGPVVMVLVAAAL
jgi:hypothetical protein